MSSLEQHAELLTGVDSDRLLLAQEKIDAYTPDELLEWADSSNVENELDGRLFRMLVAIGEDPSTIVFTGGELGNGIDALGALARVRTIQTVVAPDATIIYQPNSTASQNNMNFSRSEQSVLKSGNGRPLTDRILKTIDGLQRPDRVLAYGPSQGGTTVMDLAGSFTGVDDPSFAAAIIEAPNIQDRSLARIGVDYATSGNMLRSVIEGNFSEETSLQTRLIEDISNGNMVGYMKGIIKPDNLALIGLMRRRTLAKQIQASMKNSQAVVHAWGSAANVSPAKINRDIAHSFADSLLYRGYEYAGDHSITNNYLLSALLLHKAAHLADTDQVR